MVIHIFLHHQFLADLWLTIISPLAPFSYGLLVSVPCQRKRTNYSTVQGPQIQNLRLKKQTTVRKKRN